MSKNLYRTVDILLPLRERFSHLLEPNLQQVLVRHDEEKCFLEVVLKETNSLSAGDIKITRHDIRGWFDPHIDFQASRYSCFDTAKYILEHISIDQFAMDTLIFREDVAHKITNEICSSASSETAKLLESLFNSQRKHHLQFCQNESDAKAVKRAINFLRILLPHPMLRLREITSIAKAIDSLQRFPNQIKGINIEIAATLSKLKDQARAMSRWATCLSEEKIAITFDLDLASRSDEDELKHDFIYEINIEENSDSSGPIDEWWDKILQSLAEPYFVTVTDFSSNI